MIRYVIIFIGTLTTCSGQDNSSAQAAKTMEYPSIALANQKKEEISIDIIQSKAAWKGTKITGKHEGVISFKSGKLSFTEGRLTGGELIVDMKSIEITDIPLHETIARKNLLNHFMDEFAIHAFSTATFTFQSVEYLTDNELEVTGLLKIRGVSKPIKIQAFQNDKLFTSNFLFNRFDWRIGEDGSWFAKRLVDEMVQLEVTLIPKSL